MRRRALAALLATLLAAVWRHQAQATQPDFLAYLQGEAPALVAFNPTGLNPNIPRAELWPADAIAADLAALRPAFDGLVLYDTRPEVTPIVVETAATAGFKAVLLGVWDPLSDPELALAAALIRRWQDRLAFAIVLGNEGINDNRYRIEDLAIARDRLRAQLGPQHQCVPVTTSEPAGDYGWPPLLEFGDFLAPNIHPALDRAELPPEAAVNWVRAQARAITVAAGRPVLIKETGMPHGGAPKFTPERQRLFWSAWLARPRFEPVAPAEGGHTAFLSSAAAFEAFDTPWKAEWLHSPIEGSWGLMTIERHPYPAFRAWVEARPPAR